MSQRSRDVGSELETVRLFQSDQTGQIRQTDIVPLSDRAAPNVLDEAVAELTLSLALMITRQVPEASRVVREGKWPGSPWSPLSFCGPSLKGKTCGFIGFGNSESSALHSP